MSLVAIPREAKPVNRCDSDSKTSSKLKGGAQVKAAHINRRGSQPKYISVVQL